LKQEIEWFYSELTVPEGSDVIGSYFMANGFSEGYFGIQVFTFLLAYSSKLVLIWF
jgi:hypothetical protein